MKEGEMTKRDQKNRSVEQLARPSVLGLKPYASAKDDFKDFERDLIFIDANENPYENGMNRYPDPNQSKLKDRIAELKKVSSERILLGNGSDEILDLIFRVFMEPGKDNIVISVPTFGMFRVLCGINDIECRTAMLDQDYQLQNREIESLVDAKTKAIFICSPNNPTGNLMKKTDILKLLELGCLVVVDEAYADFADAESMIGMIDNYPKLVVTQTFSKALGMAGIRLGMCFAQKEVIDLLKKVKMPYNVNVLTQEVALRELEDISSIEEGIRALREGRAWLESELPSCKLVDQIFPSDSNFLLIRVDDADLRYKQLIEAGIVVRNRSKEPLCEQCLRVTVGTEEENEKLIDTLKSFE
jgi:histidinol-phosphate aminotransferase